MFRGSVKSTGYPLHSPVSPSLPLPCVTVCHHISTGLYPTVPLHAPVRTPDCHCMHQFVPRTATACTSSYPGLPLHAPVRIPDCHCMHQFVPRTATACTSSPSFTKTAGSTAGHPRRSVQNSKVWEVLRSTKTPGTRSGYKLQIPKKKTLFFEISAVKL
jgi:hypothetical protein